MDFHPDDQGFWHDPGPDDRFGFWLSALIAVSIISGAVAWWVA